MPKAKTMTKMLGDPAAPMELKVQMIKGLCSGDDDTANAVLTNLLQAAAAAGGEDAYREQTQKLSELLRQMMAGPLRMATFERPFECGPHGHRAQVILPDGSSAFCVVPDETLAGKMRCGDTVWLEAQAKAVLFHEPRTRVIGELARFERRVGDSVEVSLRDHGRFVYRAAWQLLAELDSEEVRPGCDLLVCPQRMMAFHGVAPADGEERFRYLSRAPVPDVVVERDLGAPPKFLADLARHLRREMTRPEAGRRYRLRRSRTHLLTGVPGSGKTFSILGFWNQMYALMSELTGVPVDELPPRVLQLRVSEVLSKWLGDSDKNIARFFDEVEELAAETFATPDGREVELPLLVCLEEADTLARARGDDAIHDRIQSTLLERLDGNRAVYRERLVIVLATTNVPGIVDSAFLRRVAGTAEHFGRLSRASFRAVLTKQLRGRALASAGAEDAAGAARRIVGDVAAWLFAANPTDRGQVEITLLGRTEPTVKRRKDFLTAALVERAVEDAGRAACDDELDGCDDPGIDAVYLSAAIDRQVRHVALQLEPENCDRFLDLPDGARVGTVRRIEQPSVLPHELERAS